MVSRARLFEAVGALSARLPRVRGKNRAVLSLYGALGLRDEAVLVDARLRSPVDYRARLDLRSWLQRLAFVSGEYEAETVRFLARLLQASPGYLLDIGANIGLISVPLQLVARTRVVAIEAVPDNARALRDNIALNGLQDEVTVLTLGVGDVPGIFDIQVEGNRRAGTGTANILPAGSTYECERIRIEVSTLDALHAQGRLPAGCGVVKIDTDGYDLKALLGGGRFLAQERPIVFGEFAQHCLNWHGQGIDDVRSWAAQAGYELWLRAPSRQMRFTRTLAADFIQDALLVPAAMAGRLAWCCQS